MKIKTNIFLVLLSVISLAACKPKKAIEFKMIIDQKERSITNILLRENGPNVEKLHCLLKKDFKGALLAIDKQEQEFNQVIKEIEAFPTNGIKLGNELKVAAINYYTAIKELQISDREDIKQQEISMTAKGEEQRASQDKQLELSRKKQEMYKKFHEKDAIFYQMQEKFSTINGI